MAFGPIWKSSKLTPHKARKAYACESDDCAATIAPGQVYYAEYRGGLDRIRRCEKCFNDGERV